jgi:NAD(P)-dependent dehydrogenase (short-subunit alcohol dehydrogenase family)
MTGGRVIVTGSAGGIGAATSRRLAAAGYEVVGIDRCAPDDPGVFSGHRHVDLTDPAAVAGCCDEIAADGPLWGVVHTAGRYPDVELDDYSLELWSAVFAVNVTAPFIISQRLAGALVPGGRIVMVVSGGAYTGSMDVGYSSSKSGQLGLMKSLARNLAARDIRVNAVSPGPIDTPMLRSMAAGNTASFINGGLVPRLGKPEEIAVAIEFLLAADNTYMTGATIDVNGGMQIR